MSDKRVCVSLRGNVGLRLVVGAGDHIPQAAGRAALHADWQDRIGEVCDRLESRKPIPHLLTALHS